MAPSLDAHSVPVKLAGRDAHGMWWWLAEYPCKDCGQVHRYPGGDGEEPLPLGWRATKFCARGSAGVVELYTRA